MHIRRVAPLRLRDPPTPSCRNFLLSLLPSLSPLQAQQAQLPKSSLQPQYHQRNTGKNARSIVPGLPLPRNAGRLEHPADIQIFPMPAWPSGRARITCGVSAQLDTTRHSTRLLSHPLGGGGSERRADAAHAKYQSALLLPTGCLRRLAWTAKTASYKPLS